MPASDVVAADALIETIQRLSSPLEPLPTGHPTRLRLLPGIRAVVFDIYGTLMISGSGDVGLGDAAHKEKAFNDALADVGITPSRDASIGGAQRLKREIVRSHERLREAGADYPEVDIVQVWSSVLDQIGWTGDTSPEMLRQIALGYECRANPVWPMPGCNETLPGLQARGLSLGIVSNAQFYTPLLFKALLGHTVGELGFDDTLCAWSYFELRGKPSPHLLYKVLSSLRREHDLSPEQVLCVGNDRLKDIWPAATAGCRTALFAGDRRSLRLHENDERCRFFRPDVVIDDLEQLLHVVL